jgi:hypothetical protein
MAKPTVSRAAGGRTNLSKQPSVKCYVLVRAITSDPAEFKARLEQAIKSYPPLDGSHASVDYNIKIVGHLFTIEGDR